MLAPVPSAFFPIFLPVVLSAERCVGLPKRHDGKIYKIFHLKISSEGRNAYDSEAVDLRLDNQVAQRNHHRLNCRRNPDFQDSPADPLLKRNITDP